MPNNKVISMTETEIQSATAALANLRRQMTFIVTLSPGERKAARAVTKKAVHATQMRAVLARQHRDGLPPSFDLRAFEHEVALMTALQSCLAAATQLQTDIRDTFLVVSADAVQNGKVAFGHLEVMAGATGDITQALRITKLRTRSAKQVAKGAAAASAAAANNPAPGSPAAPGTSVAPGTSSSPSPGPPVTGPPSPADAGEGDKSAGNKAA